MITRAISAAGGLCVAAACAQAQIAPSESARNLVDLSLEELSNISISTVSGRPESLARALGSVYVISGDDIRRSGANSLPEALRLAPNLQVARAGSMGYAITARGFNSQLANKLLVLIDGRSIYTPTFSGVFWEAHDLVLADVERIEVISGPGGVLWGANAVNGVINVITRASAATRGGLVGLEASSNAGSVYVRGGGDAGQATYRVYAKRSRWDSLDDAGGADQRDGWDRMQAGFRLDLEGVGHSLTVQGDVYTGVGDQIPSSSKLRGNNILLRWEHETGNGDSLKLQAYYDSSARPQQDLDIVDLELQHALSARGKHRVLWGIGTRHARDRILNSEALALLPADKTLRSWSAFVVDEIALGDNLDLSIGARLNHNSYTGSEVLPSLRVGWRAGGAHLLWTSVSKSVRAPSRFDRELFLPGQPPYALSGGPEFRSEVARVLEVGYRGQPTPQTSLSATVFYHDLDRVRTVGPAAGAAQVQNNREGSTRGVEGWGSLQVTSQWRLNAGYTRLETRLRPRSGQIDLQPPDNLNADPNSWWSLRSTHELPHGWEVDVYARRYGALQNRDVPSYSAVDLRLGRRMNGWDISATVRNLFDDGHIEWAPGAAELRRGVFVQVVRLF